MSFRDSSCSGGSTSSLRKHLVLVHDMNLEEGKEDAREDQETSLSKRIKVNNNQSSLLDNTKQQSLSEILARLAAEDGFSYLRIAHSKFIRSSLSAKGFIPPTSHSTVSVKVREYSIQMKNCVKEELAELLTSNARFSVTLMNIHQIQTEGI